MSVCLLFPEANLKPSILFMASETNSPVGVVLIYFFNLGLDHDQTGIANMDDYNFILLRYGSLHMSHSIDHIHLVFGIALNNKCSHEIS